MFICLSYAVYSTQLLKQPVIKNMLCKQNWNGGKADCVHLAFCIRNQAEGYKARFSVSLSQREMWLTVQCQSYFEAWRLFSTCFVKMWSFCRLYWLHCFFGRVSSQTHLRRAIWKDALSFLKEGTRLIWNHSLAMILFDEQHTAVYKSEENLQLDDWLWSVRKHHLPWCKIFTFYCNMCNEAKNKKISVVSPLQQSVLPQ